MAPGSSQGFRHDPVLRMVAELARGTAWRSRCWATTFTSQAWKAMSFPMSRGWAPITDYEVTLSGDKASGTLEVEADNSPAMSTSNR